MSNITDKLKITMYVESSGTGYRKESERQSSD